MVEGLQENREHMIRIAVTGPESTGKSSLTEKIAQHYNTVYVTEYAREYIEKLDHPYTYQDVECIALCQMEIENTVLKNANRLLVADTELLVIKIWMEHKYHRIPDWLEKKILEREYDLYLLCDIDIPWENDPQREHPDLRSYFLDLYEKELKRRGFNYILISGKHDQRFQEAIKAIEKLIAEI